MGTKDKNYIGIKKLVTISFNLCDLWGIALTISSTKTEALGKALLLSNTCIPLVKVI